MGDYITLEVPTLDAPDVSYHREITTEIAAQLKGLVPDIENKKFLWPAWATGKWRRMLWGRWSLTICSLRDICSGSTGKIRRLPGAWEISAPWRPGVMAQTGIETREILLGTVKETGPDLLIVIDALAARNVRRLNKTIQITNTGIAPGAGVGNRRFGIDKASMGISVIAIGVPTVIDAASIVNDTVETC